jgi:hypothetical protein
VIFVVPFGPPLLAPVTVTLVRFVVADELTLKVRVEVAGFPGETLTLAGLKLAVAPLGSPLALKATLPANPLPAVTVTVVGPLGLVERLSVRLEGFALRETVPPTLTTKVIGAA